MPNNGSHSVAPPEATEQDARSATTSKRPAGSDVDNSLDLADHPNRGDLHTDSGPLTEQRILPAKTSAAAVFALVFGLSALLSVLTIILSPLGLVLSIIGIILSVVGMKMAKRVGVTGRGVAIGALILSVIALLLSITIAAGATTVLNNKKAVDRINKQVTKLENNFPKKSIPTT